jgi:hypothetical protein
MQHSPLVSLVLLEGLPRSLRPWRLLEYKGRTVKEHTNFIMDYELAFYLTLKLNTLDELHCNFTTT